MKKCTQADRNQHPGIRGICLDKIIDISVTKNVENKYEYFYEKKTHVKSILSVVYFDTQKQKSWDYVDDSFFLDKMTHDI